MSFIFQAIISLAISSVLIVTSFNVPAKWFSLSQPKLGTVSLTTLNSTDNIADFPTTYNANNTIISNQKVDVASTTWAQLTTAANLSTVGTIGTGVWQGTDVEVPYGGTGASSLTQFRMLFGSSTNAIWAATTTGTQGQFLTSFGSNAIPQWTTSALDLAGNYAWTGIHSFAGSTTIAYQNTATSTLDGKFGLGVNVVAASTSPMWYAIDQGAVNAYAIQLDPPISKYTTGLQIAFRPSATNTTASTINVNNIGAKSIKKGKNGSDLTHGDLRPSDIAHLTYDGTNFIFSNPPRATEFDTTVLINAPGDCPTASGGTLGWTDIQMGYKTGTTSSIALLKAQQNSGGATTLAFRKNGDTSVFASSTPSIGSDYSSAYIIVPTDSSGIVEWRCGNTGTAFIITLEAFW